MTEPIDLPSGAVTAMPADLAPAAAIEVPTAPQLVDLETNAAEVLTVPVPGPPGRDGDDLSPEDLAELTEDVREDVQTSVDASLTPPVDLVLVFENALE